MKKILALFLTFILFTMNSCFAFSELFYVKNIAEGTANSIIRTNLDTQNFTVVNEKPYYAIDSRNNGDYVVIIAQQSGRNLFYYYQSNNNKKINNAILKTFKNYGSEYEQSFNTTTLNVYDNLAQRLIVSGNNPNTNYNKYTFDDNDTPQTTTYTTPATTNTYNTNTYTTTTNKTNIGSGKTAYTPKTITTQQNYTNNNYSYNQNANSTQNYNNYNTYNTNQNNNYTVSNNKTPANNGVYLTPGTTVKSQQATILKGSVVSIDSGTKIKTYLQNPINTSSAQKGDRVVAVLTDDLRYNGVTIAPQGSLVYGSLTKARHATYGSRNGRVVIDFNQLVTPESKVYEISTENIDFTVTNDGKLARTVGNAVAGAAIGALAGLLFGAMGDYSLLAATAIGAGVGAGTSLVGSGAERGVDAEIPSFTELELTLTKPFKATVSY